MLLIIQVGRANEIYGSSSEEIVKFFKIKPHNTRGYVAFGVNDRRLNSIIKKAKELGISGVLIKQTDCLTEKIKVRIPLFQWKLNKDII